MFPSQHSKFTSAWALPKTEGTTPIPPLVYLTATQLINILTYFKTADRTLFLYSSFPMAGSSTFTWAHALQLHSTLSPFVSPLPGTHSAFADVKPLSWRRYNIAGLLVTVYGLQELLPDVSEVTCLWLLHGRGDTQDSMGHAAAGLLGAWNQRRQPGQKSLIAVCIDQRNHGCRMIDNVANVSWKQGTLSIRCTFR